MASVVSTQLVAPASAGIGQTAQFRLVQTLSDGSLNTVTTGLSWWTSNPAVLTIDATGLVTCLSQGTATVGVYDTSGSYTASYTVGPAVLLSLAVTAPASTLQVGSNQQMVATATYSNGTTRVVTQQCIWNSSNPGASVTSLGLVRALAATQVNISASIASIVGVLALTVTVLPSSLPVLGTPAFRSHWTQILLNYFDEKDTRVREGAYTIDAQFLNTSAQQMESSARRLSREINASRLTNCPANIDNRGVYYEQSLPTSFNYGLGTHVVQATRGADAITLTPYEDELPVPVRVVTDPNFTPVAMTNPVLFQISGEGDVANNTWSTQRLYDLPIVLPGRLQFWLDGIGFNAIAIKVKISGQRWPSAAWASQTSTSSETILITDLGWCQSKFAWQVIDEVQVMGLPADVSLTCQMGTFGFSLLPDPDRLFTHPSFRDVLFDRYWTYQNGYLTEQFLMSNVQGFQYIQSYQVPPIQAIAVEPNTRGLFVASGTTLYYMDRCEPLPQNLGASALTAEPYYGLAVYYDEVASGAVRYVDLQPIPYAASGQVTTWRYLVQTPTGATFALTPDGTLAEYTATAGWRQGIPSPLTLPLVEVGTYVFTLQCVGANGTLSDSNPYPNLGFTPLAQFDLSGIVPSIRGLSYDDRNRLWVWSGDFAFPLELQYDGYVIDPESKAIYLTDSVNGLTIDGLQL